MLRLQTHRGFPNVLLENVETVTSYVILVAVATNKKNHSRTDLDL